jgi:hypothetical protein
MKYRDVSMRYRFLYTFFVANGFGLWAAISTYPSCVRRFTELDTPLGEQARDSMKNFDRAWNKGGAVKSTSISIEEHEVSEKSKSNLERSDFKQEYDWEMEAKKRKEAKEKKE